MTNEEEKKAFEAGVIKNWNFPSLLKTEGGEYKNLFIEHAYKGWQARAELGGWKRSEARYNAICIQLVPAQDGYSTLTHVECHDMEVADMLTNYAREIIKILPNPPKQQGE